MPAAPGGEFLPALTRSLKAGIELRTGESAGDPAAVRVYVGGTPTADQLAACPTLEALVVPYAGIPKATRALLLEHHRALPVHNLHHNADATAELAFTLMLAAAKRVAAYDQKLRQGDWRPRYDDSEALLLSGRRALVLGYGAIGRRVAGLCRALDMTVHVARRSGRDDPARPDLVFGTLADVRASLPETDVLLVCLPATPETLGVVDAGFLAALPRHAVVVNVGRGALIDEAALHAALEGSRLGAAGLDVWYRYPRSEAERAETLPSSLPFHELPQVVLSPHRGGHATCTERRRAKALAHLLNQHAAGERMHNRVDVEAGY